MHLSIDEIKNNIATIVRNQRANIKVKEIAIGIQKEVEKHGITDEMYINDDKVTLFDEDWSVKEGQEYLEARNGAPTISEWIKFVLDDLNKGSDGSAVFDYRI